MTVGTDSHIVSSGRLDKSNRQLKGKLKVDTDNCFVPWHRETILNIQTSLNKGLKVDSKGVGFVCIHQKRERERTGSQDHVFV